ncbi:MAG TPA: type II toxin-antitoxin system prevent-host-death family antitoxin [Acidimicrobiales bacterium]|nr:type II toxin-antitoxin system prevent-host-death family antitoxin [Acidimicrobiales bacterium]
MSTVASRELRNQTRDLLDRVAAGDEVTITVDGRPVARLVPLPHRTRWLSRDRFVRDILATSADRGLRDELATLAPDTTDDLPW